MNRRAIRRLQALALVGALWGCALGASAVELTVSAAASLTQAFKEIGAAFEAQHPGDTVRFNVAASGQLLQQIARGAPVDVFASADQETMHQAEQQHLVRPGTRREFAGNSLVVVVPRDSAAAPATLADLQGDRYRRIAIGVPAKPRPSEPRSPNGR